MRTLLLTLVAGAALAQDRPRVWVKPTYTEFFYAGARVREPDEAPGIAALRDAWAMLADEKRAKQANGGHLPAGYKVYRGGWWYEADGRGGDTFCESCNGMTEAAALAWWHADQARRKATTRAPGVPAAPVFHAGHDCPRCRRPEYVQERQLPDGTHTHRCANCAAVWRH
jgi:hypothetical protein